MIDLVAKGKQLLAPRATTLELTGGTPACRRRSGIVATGRSPATLPATPVTP
jgi:hypothetical protein